MYKIYLLPSFQYQAPFILYTCIFSFTKFMDMPAKGKIKPEDLPPTERAAVQQSLCVHQQTVVSQTLNNLRLDLLNWGWKQDGACFTPIQTNNDVAPAEVMKFIRCNCKSLSNMCNSMLCKFKRYGLKCVTACGQYRNGEICKNSEVIVFKINLFLLLELSSMFVN